MYGAHVQGMASITAAASTSVTLLAAVSGARLHLQRGIVSVLTPAATAGGWLSIYEAAADGSSGATVMNIPVISSNERVHNIDFGEKGYTASAIGSRIVITENCDATVHAVFTGYAR